MPKLIKKKFFEIEIPLINEKFEARANSISELDGKTIKMDLTRQLRGKSIDISFRTEVKDNKAKAYPVKLILLPSFITHMLHPGIDYVEGSFLKETKDSKVLIKPFLITRKKVSRAVKKTLRNSAENWLADYLKEKTNDEVFEDILSNQLQKQLSLRLKKVYPLAMCEIRMFTLKEQIKK